MAGNSDEFLGCCRKVRSRPPVEPRAWRGLVHIPKRMAVRFNTFHDARWQKVLFFSPTKDPLIGVGKIRKARTIPHVQTYAGLLFVYVEIVLLHRNQLSLLKMEAVTMSTTAEAWMYDAYVSTISASIRGFSSCHLREQISRCRMPYLSNADLPPSLRNKLPPHAQDIYRTAFNNAYENHADNPIEEADAHNIAWAAVERFYVKEGGEWVARGVPG